MVQFNSATLWAATLAVAALTTGGCVQVNGSPIETGSIAQLKPGMSRDDVVRVLGPPSGFLAENHGVECLIYGEREMSTLAVGPFTSMQTPRQRIVALKDNRLVQQQTIEPGAVAPNVSMTLPGSSTPNSVCAEIAARAGPAAKQSTTGGRSIASSDRR